MAATTRPSPPRGTRGGVLTYDTQANVTKIDAAYTGACIISEVCVRNNSASTRYFQLFDATTAPIDTSVPTVMPIDLDPGETIIFTYPGDGLYFSTAISAASSSTFGTKTITGVADLWITITYRVVP